MILGNHWHFKGRQACRETWESEESIDPNEKNSRPWKHPGCCRDWPRLVCFMVSHTLTQASCVWRWGTLMRVGHTLLGKPVVLGWEQAQGPFPSGGPPSWDGFRPGWAGAAFWELQVFLTKCGVLSIRQFTGHQQDDKAKIFWRGEGKLLEGPGKARVDIYLNQWVNRAVLRSPGLSPKQEIQLYELQWLRS